MTSRIWELHARRLDGAIRSTPDGEAEIGGLVLSEKAYLLAMRDYRPEQLVRLVHSQGAQGALETLVAHYAMPDSQQQSGGRRLVATRGPSGGPSLARSDEIPEPATPPGHL